ncbi:hypothetical protein SISSUDRAFT_653661 [Sistotremastrum suecicum HHB10207 ss-3]|uniref:F-box domain-containing protein n=1 Tax=Sistotremastrum suecicum HHB10207 ss-3 TaxID=1314776 RepID=A0A166E8X3_9AGAM|nr:hypothetical protein SISSUDRAFT_653661 [Sistotremastrum suecicum HHB10207 ss-3]
MGLETLPPEIISKLSIDLVLHDLISMAQTCRWLRMVIIDNREILLRCPNSCDISIPIGYSESSISGFLLLKQAAKACALATRVKSSGFSPLYPKNTTIISRGMKLDRRDSSRSKILFVVDRFVVWSSDQEWSLIICDIISGQKFEHQVSFPVERARACGELSEDRSRLTLAILSTGIIYSPWHPQPRPEILVLKISLLPEIGRVEQCRHLFLGTSLILVQSVNEIVLKGSFILIFDHVGSKFICDWRNVRGAKLVSEKREVSNWKPISNVVFDPHGSFFIFTQLLGRLTDEKRLGIFAVDIPMELPSLKGMLVSGHAQLWPERQLSCRCLHITGHHALQNHHFPGFNTPGSTIISCRYPYKGSSFAVDILPLPPIISMRTFDPQTIKRLSLDLDRSEKAADVNSCWNVKVQSATTTSLKIGNFNGTFIGIVGGDIIDMRTFTLFGEQRKPPSSIYALFSSVQSLSRTGFVNLRVPPEVHWVSTKAGKNPTSMLLDRPLYEMAFDPINGRLFFLLHDNLCVAEY